MKGRDGVVLNPAEMRAVISPGAKNVKREDEPPLKQITDAEFRALSTQSSTLLLDIRDRETFGEGHEKGRSTFRSRRCSCAAQPNSRCPGTS